MRLPVSSRTCCGRGKRSSRISASRRLRAGARVYRRADVERVLRIKQLLYGEGLTLAGVRRKLTEEQPAERRTGSGAGEYR